MIDLKTIPRKVSNDASGKLSFGIGPSALTFDIESGGNKFPGSIYGLATSAGNETTLNSTGIAALTPAILVGDVILNLTDESFAIVVSITTDQIITTHLKGGSDNSWSDTDQWCVGLFEVTLEKKDSEGVRIGDPENVTIKGRVGNSFDVESRGVLGTNSASWSVDDLCTLAVSSSSIEEEKKRVAILESIAEDLLHKNVTIEGVKDFDELPICTVVPTSGSQLVNKTYVDAKSGGGFTLTGERSSVFMPRKLEWVDVIDDGTYKLYRKIDGGSFVLLATLSHTLSEYVDSDLIDGEVSYYVISTSGSNVIILSNEILFSGTINDAIAAGDYGDGSDGDYTGGDLERSNIYQFSSFNLDSTMEFTGVGAAIIFVDGDMVVSENAEVNNPTVFNYSGAASILIDGNTQLLHPTAQNGGVGGVGGAGGVGRFGSSDGGAGAGGGAGSGGNGNNGGAGGVPAGGAGGGGGIAGRSLTPYVGGVAPTGGGSGISGNHKESIIFVVSGDISVIGGSVFNLQGQNGTNGASGGNGATGQAGNTGAQGGGGGGAGGGGGNGGKIIFASAGAITDDGTYNNNGGDGGDGGNGGNGGTSGGGAGNGSPGGIGGAGTDGLDGNVIEISL